MSDNDVKYYTRRAQEERRLAASATEKCARNAHERIATEYELIARGAEEPALRIVAG